MHLLGRMIVLSIVLAYVASLIDGLRFYGTLPLILPFSAIGHYQPRVDLNNADSGMVAAFDSFLFFYNSAFPGGSRLGCGIGMISAAFWTLHSVSGGCWPQRAALGLMAGAVIGFRCTLMLSSSAKFVLGSTVLFSLAFLVYMLVTDREKEVASLPLVLQE